MFLAKGVYVPPSADKAEACDIIHAIAADSLSILMLFVTIIGDFHHVNWGSTYPTFHQFISCTMWENRYLDLLYANTTDAYRSIALSPLGGSDHILILLIYLYVTEGQRLSLSTRRVSVLSVIMVWGFGKWDGQTWCTNSDSANSGNHKKQTWQRLCGPPWKLWSMCVQWWNWYPNAD